MLPPEPASEAMNRRSEGGGAARRSGVVVVGTAAAMFIALAAYLRSVERTVVRAAAEAGAAGPAAAAAGAGEVAPPVAGVRRAVRAMRLVTVQVDTVVASSAADESWRGDVTATLRAPARLYYGTDLSGLGDGAVAYNAVLNEFVVRVPRPVRIATEVYAEEGTPTVRTGWGRLRTRAGEYYLGLARRALTDRARAVVLSPAEHERVERLTREQIAGLVRAIAGEGARVSVVFEDGPAGRGATAAATAGAVAGGAAGAGP
jgi:hypothetical protein